MAMAMDTDTDMQAIKSSTRIAFIFGGLLCSSVAFSGELDLTANLSADLFSVDSDSTSQGEVNAVDGIVTQQEVSLGSIYASKKLNVTAGIDYSQVSREDESSEFLSYRANSVFSIYKKSLNFLSSYSLSQRNSDSQAGAFNDKIVGSESLVDVITYSNSLTYEIENAKYLRLSAALNSSSTKSKQDTSLENVSEFASNRYNTDTTSFNLFLGSGSSSRATEWSMQMATSESERGSILSDYQRSNFSANISVHLNSNISIVGSGRVNKNEIENQQAISNSLSYSQVGSGIRFNFTKGSYFSVLGYSSKSGEQERNNFIGGEFNWIFSKRTNLNFTADRNQFGEAYGFTAQQASRYLTISASYREGIDINSRQSVSTDSELNDEVVRMERGNVSVSYDNKRKLRASLSYSFSSQESLEESSIATNNREVNSYSFSTYYQWTPKTTFNINLTQSENDYLPVAGQQVAADRKDNNKSLSLGINSNLSKHLSSKLEVSRRSRTSSRSDFDSSDNRVNLNFKYSFH